MRETNVNRPASRSPRMWAFGGWALRRCRVLLCAVAGLGLAACASDGAPNIAPPQVFPEAAARDTRPPQLQADPTPRARPGPGSLATGDFNDDIPIPPASSNSATDSGSRYLPVANPIGQVAIETPPLGQPVYRAP